MIKILAGDYTVCAEDWSFGGRTFRVPFFRLYFVVGGRAEVTIDDGVYPLEAGRAYFLPGNLPSRNRFIPEAPLRVHWLHGAPLDLAIDKALGNVREARQWPLEALAFWRETYAAIDDKVFLWRGARRLALDALVMALVADLLKDQAASLEGPARNDRSLRAALEFMDREYLRNPSLREIAAKAHLAPNYFHRRFKAFFDGATPQKYMEKRRLYDARELLLVGEKSVREIAETIGYRDAFYFSRAFKKFFGSSPSRVRRFPGP